MNDRYDIEAIKRALNIEQVMERYGLILKRTGPDQLMAECPFHPDKTPSLSIAPSKGLWHCFGCETSGDVIGFVEKMEGVGFQPALARAAEFAGVSPLLALPKSANGTATKKPPIGDAGNTLEETTQPKVNGPAPNAASPQVVDTYRYINGRGELQYEVVRLTPKRFRIRRPDGNGGWHWNLGDTPRVLFRLPRVLAAEEVFLVEGERDCLTLEAGGVVGTTASGGASQPWLSQYVEVLAGKNVTIIPDNDSAGFNHAFRAAQSLIGKAASVKLVELPSVKEKGDVSDWIESGHTVEELLGVVTPSPVMTLDDLRRWGREHGIDSNCVASSTKTADWPSPKPLSASLPAVEPFDSELLPGPLRDYVVDIAARLQVPVDFPAATIVVALAGAIGRRAGIHPKVHDDWEVVPNLWGGIVGRPGLMKSPCISAVLKPLVKMQSKAMERYKRDLERYESELKKHKILESVWEKESKKAAGDGIGIDDFCPASAGTGEKRSAVKLTERTHEKATKALHSRREGRRSEAAFD